MNSKQKPLGPLLQKADKYAHAVYHVSRQLPQEERFGITSQLRRAALSVPLNIVEGYARKSSKYFQQFLHISYGSLKESQYVLGFCVEENLIQPKDISSVHSLGDEIGAMLWSSLKKLEKS